MSYNRYCKACQQWHPRHTWPKTQRICNKCRAATLVENQRKRLLRQEIRELESKQEELQSGKPRKYYRKKQQETIEQRLQRLVEQKNQGSCYFCHENDVCCLDYHHVNPAHKISSVRDAFIRSLEEGIIESAKCLLVCANCHRKIHAGKLAIPDEVLQRFIA